MLHLFHLIIRQHDAGQDFYPPLIISIDEVGPNHVADRPMASLHYPIPLRVIKRGQHLLDS